MEPSLRLPAVLGALGGAFLAIVGMLALSPLFVERVSAVLIDDQPQVVLQMRGGSFVVLALVFSAIFGAVTAYVARTAVPVLQPDLQVRGGPVSAVLLGTLLGAILGVLAAFVGLSVVGEQSEEMVAIPFLAGAVLVTAAGAVFGAGTALGVYVLSEPVLEGPEAEEVREVRRRLISSVAIPVASFIGIVAVAVGLGMLFLRFHTFAPVLGLAVAGGVLAFAALIASRPRERIPVGEVLLAVAGVGVVVLVIVAVLLAVDSGEEDHGEESQAPAATEETS